LICAIFAIFLFVPTSRSEFRLVWRSILAVVFIIICIHQLLQLLNKDIKLLIDNNGIALADGERISWNEIGIVKLTEARDARTLANLLSEKNYFVEIYARNNEHEQGERLLHKIDATDFDVEVEDISLALKRITKQMNIIVEFNVT